MKRGLGRQQTALEHIENLFEQAVLRPAFAKRYVSLARRMSTRHKVRIPQKWKRRFCKECSAFLVPGRNCRVRKRAGRIVITCLGCMRIKRIRGEQRA